MANLDIASFDTWLSLIRSIWQSERPNADNTRYSDLWLFSRILAKIAQRMSWTIDRALSAMHPATTWGDYLDAWLWFAGLPNGAGGYGRIEARGSSTTDGVTVTATGVTVDLQGYQLVDSGGRVYEIAESYAFAGAGSANLDIDAIDVGVATNLESGDAVTFTSPPANVQAAATIATDLSGGANRETDAEGRQRLIERFQLPPASGNVADWIDTIQSASAGELDAYVWPWRQNQPTGWGLTDYCALQRGASRSARHIGSGDTLYTTIGSAVNERMPIEHYYYSRQLTLTTNPQDIDVLLTLADFAISSHRCDFDAYGAAGAHKPKVSAISAVGLQVTASKNITGWGDDRDIEVGHRVVISGAQATVDTVGVGGNDKFTVEAWFDDESDDNPYPWPSGWDPTAGGGHYICSGGGVIMDVVQAIFEDTDSLGPARGNYASPSVSGWESDLTQLSLQTAAINATGGLVADVTVTAPAATVTPTAGSGATTERVVIDDLAVFEDKS